MSGSQLSDELQENQGGGDADAFVHPSDIHAAPPPFVGVAIKRSLRLPTDDEPPPRPPPPVDPFEQIPLPGFVIFGDDTKTSNFFWGNASGTKKSFLVELTSEEELQDFLTAARTPSEETSLVMGQEETQLEGEGEVINELEDEQKSPTSTSSYLGTLTEEDEEEEGDEDVNGGVGREGEADGVNGRTSDGVREAADTSIVVNGEASTETELHCAVNGAAEVAPTSHDDADGGGACASPGSGVLRGGRGGDSSIEKCVVVADDGIQDIILEQGESGETPQEPSFPSSATRGDTLSPLPPPESQSLAFSDQCVQVPSPPSREDHPQHPWCPCSGSPWRSQVKIHCCHPQDSSSGPCSGGRSGQERSCGDQGGVNVEVTFKAHISVELSEESSRQTPSICVEDDKQETNCAPGKSEISPSDVNGNPDDCVAKSDSPRPVQKLQVYGTLGSPSFADNFEASVRLKRLEERLKKFTYTKKLLRDPPQEPPADGDFATILKSLGGESEVNFDESCLHPTKESSAESHTREDSDPIDRALSCHNQNSHGDCEGSQLVRLLSSVQKLCESGRSDVGECRTGSGKIDRDTTEVEAQVLPTQTVHNVLSGAHARGDVQCCVKADENSNFLRDPPRKTHLSPDSSSIDSAEELCKLFPEESRSSPPPPIHPKRLPFFSPPYRPFRATTPPPPPPPPKTSAFRSCEFDALKYASEGVTYPNGLLECYDELESDVSEESDDNTCQCSLEAVPLYHHPLVIMRESAGPLRGLLKKPNRPPQQRKNRVVFDETRNEFFEADYIILIREDCPYDEEDEEPCTCGEHELVRLCCEEGCQCPGYTDDCRTPQSPKYAPPMEFVDQATLSPPEGYKDGGALTNALGGALGGHVFGAQHIQQLQVIQKLQQQRAAMLAARGQATAPQQGDASMQQPVCMECAECAECAAKQMQEECDSPCSDETGTLEMPHVAIVPIKTTSPERRVTQKEIIAGEERPKYLAIKQQLEAATQENGVEKVRSSENPRYVVETITMTTVTERRIVRQANETVPSGSHGSVGGISASGAHQGAAAGVPGTAADHADRLNDSTSISGILKGGKLWKSEQTQCDDTTNITSDEEGNVKRSVRFTENIKDTERELCDGEVQSGEAEEQRPTEIMLLKKQSSLFHNALRPNSALRQLFPAVSTASTAAAPLTHEALRAFDESKRGPTLAAIGGGGLGVSSDSETDTIRRTIERNALRRSLIKYEPKKKPVRPDTSLEERIRQLTCDIDEPLADGQVKDLRGDLERRDSPAGEENPQQSKYMPDKSFSPSSSASSSSSGSTSAYRKITDIFHRDRRQERIPEADENPIVIIPQDCRCPAAPDLGMGVQMPQTHTQIHQTPPRQNESRRQFLSTLAPLTACVAGQRDDFSYYTLSAGDRASTASSQCSEYSLGDIEAVLHDDEVKQVAPDVIAGTPGQESDELAAFAQQEASRTDRIKKRYSGNEAPNVNTNSTVASDDDDEQNDYGFNKRPSVRGIKPKFGTTNEILQQMQAQLAQPGPIQTTQVVQQTHTTIQQPPPPHMIQKIHPANAIIHTVTSQQQQLTTTTGSNAAQWAYFSAESQQTPPQQQQQPQQQQLQRSQSTSGASTDVVATNANYYNHLPAVHGRHSFHGHHEATIYQNCHSVVEQQQYGRFARSPTRRPESPPPLRNYHQTMVLIPYNNTESFARYATSNEQIPGQQFRRLEYQQVTQQTIRVPMGYPLPGMQLHVVAGRGGAPHANYASFPRPRRPGNYAYVTPGGQEKEPPSGGVKYIERGAPEGAASAPPGDASAGNGALMSPVSGAPHTTSTGAAQTTTSGVTTTTSAPATGAVFYAMNV
ncbi:uncharacterized protein LOC132264923 [Phlebotomus argentipes]|uniref:uncharacterized protein LOC132264923 n=1 Tax=Phlebotomus argentipes TaxID=94469 RepID=UPI002892A895|nr:uncharacterized protein LOC132264923 [Phlebotomus argentipes]